MKGHQERFSKGVSKRKNWKHYWKCLFKKNGFCYYCIPIREDFFIQPLTSQKGKSSFCHFFFSLSSCYSHLMLGAVVVFLFAFRILEYRGTKERAQHSQRRRGAPQPSPLTACGLFWQTDMFKAPPGHWLWLKIHTHTRSARSWS